MASYLGGSRSRSTAPPSALGSRRTDALFAYLAHTGTSHPREHLAELLWEPGNPTRSAGNLRVLLTNLRRQAAEFVDITRTTVTFNDRADAWVDSRAFLEAAEKALATQGSDDRDGSDESALATLRHASAMCRGEFLSHLDLQDATRFDDWLRDERARLHGLRGRVLARLVELELGTGDFAAALQDAGLLIRVQPWQETSHQLMIRARRATGDDAGAIKHFEMFDAQHRAEFGVARGVDHAGPGQRPGAPRRAGPHVTDGSEQCAARAA